MTAALVPVWTPKDFAQTVADAQNNAAVARMVNDGILFLPPVTLSASRGRCYRGEHRYNRFLRRGLTVDDIKASL